MPLLMHPVIGKQKSWDLCSAFVTGAPKNAPDAHVFYGVNDSNITEWRRVRKHGLPFWYIDNSYFDSVRGQQFRVTFNRIQVDARTRSSDGQRFAKLGLEIKPWVRANARTHVVLVQQSDAFMRDIVHAADWFDNEQRNWAAKGEPVKVRLWQPDKLKLQQTLLQDLTVARLLVTHSSAAAVTAVLEGVPVIVEEDSALYGAVCSTDPAVDQRHRFLSVLADNQFTIDEMKSGEAWSWLVSN